ncbi:MAG TPA: heme-binding protein [Solirubrobacteraceae bacterium]|nr:heme-binding protein [Solirubrobacteraceae bacterium]
MSEDELGTLPPAVPNELPAPLTTALSIPSNFRFDAVHAVPAAGQHTTPPPLGPLTHFKGSFRGNGFNTIFRPDNSFTPTQLPIPVQGSDNVLELNLTQETLSFSAPLGSVPNRGSVQRDAFLNGVPYLQTINDVTTGQPIGIHVEPGLWVIVPPTGDPHEGSTLVRMASIPHGTTINAQGTFQQHAGAPNFGSEDITPFSEDQPSSPISFPSQTAHASGTARIPQDLTSFINDGTITQAILNDPNEVLREANNGLTVLDTITITIFTAPASPLFGGGTDNIAFLWGNAGAVTSANPSGQNAQTERMRAAFWIETVQRTITVPAMAAGHQATIHPQPTHGSTRQPVPTFLVRPPQTLTSPTTITVTYTQIQYSQRVVLNFNGLTWPHVSVATLVPAAAVTVPASAFH